MAKEKIRQIGLQDLGRFGIGEETRTLYLDGEQLVTRKDLLSLKDKFDVKQTLDAIPLHLREQFVPLLIEQFQKFYDDDFIPGMRDMSEAFNKAGGTEEQWDVLTQAFHSGDYDRLTSNMDVNEPPQP